MYLLNINAYFVDKKKVLLAYENPIRMELFLKIFFSYWKHSFWSSWITWAGQIPLCFFTFAFLSYLTFKERGKGVTRKHICMFCQIFSKVSPHFSHTQEKEKSFSLNSICSCLPDAMEHQEQRWYCKTRNLITESVL